MNSDATDYLRYSTVLQNQSTPCAFVDLDRFDENARALVQRAGNLKIRVASKSVRSLALLQRVLKIPGFHGILAYSGWEAIHLSNAGIDDIVVAYPIVQAKEIQAVAHEVKKGRSITLMVDRVEHLEILSKSLRQDALSIPIAIDMDMSTRLPAIHFGVRRSFIHDEASLSLLLKALKKFPELRLVGMMGYEAQIAGIPDQDVLMRFLKKRSIHSIASLRQKLVAQTKGEGHSLKFVNGGGTGSFESTRLDSSVTELAAGSGLFAPTLFDGYDLFQHKPSAFFALSVTRKPESNIATCFSGGYIASGAIDAKKAPTPVFPKGLKLLKHEGAGEVQTPVTGAAARKLHIGDFVFFRHAKAGELCERFNQLHLISGNQIVESVPTYRGEGCNFG